MPNSKQSTIDATNDRIRWIMDNQLWFDQRYFERGLMVFGTELPKTPLTSTLNINGRELSFAPRVSNQIATSKAYRKTSVLVTQLFNSEQGKASITSLDNADIVVNNKRREEQFFPLQFANDEALYVYPWSTKPIHNFTGFTHFATAGCMFGGNLQGQLTSGQYVSLIDHNLAVPPGEIIHKLFNDEKANPFELTLFAEFEKNCLLIQALHDGKSEKVVYYHLPYYDYLLFGLKLYIQQKMTYECLVDLVDKVWQKKEEHIQRLSEIAASFSINLTFTSPFNGLFQQVSTPLEVLVVLKTLLSPLSSSASSEADTVALILHQLSTLPGLYTNDWATVAHKNSNDLITNIESLFKVGNTLVVNALAQQADKGKVCTIYPLAEKQIQVNYDSLAKKGYFPQQPVVHLTTLNSVFTYTPTTQGLLFYCTCFLEQITNALKDQKGLVQSAKNIGLFAHKPFLPDHSTDKPYLEP